MMKRLEINVSLLPMKSEVFWIALALSIVAGKAQKKFTKHAALTNKSARFNFNDFDFRSSGDHRDGVGKQLPRMQQVQKSFTPTTYTGIYSCFKHSVGFTRDALIV
jgi:hypothetical protein